MIHVIYKYMIRLTVNDCADNKHVVDVVVVVVVGRSCLEVNISVSSWKSASHILALEVINVGALIGVIAAPWMLGQIIGGIMGAHILASIKAAFVRKVLIVMLFATSAKLSARGIEGLFGISVPLI